MSAFKSLSTLLLIALACLACREQSNEKLPKGEQPEKAPDSLETAQIPRRPPPEKTLLLLY